MRGARRRCRGVYDMGDVWTNTAPAMASGRSIAFSRCTGRDSAAGQDLVPPSSPLPGELFEQIVSECSRVVLVKGERPSTDGSIVLADANSDSPPQESRCSGWNVSPW